jgi:hypothetical protein
MFGQIANTPAHVHGMRPDVKSVYLHRSIGGSKITRRDFHRCRLARTIGPQEANNLAGLHRQGYLVDRFLNQIIPRWIAGATATVFFG